MSLLDLPIEVLGLIAESAGPACRAFWYYVPAFRCDFQPRRYRELFIFRGSNDTYMFGRLQSIDDLPSQAISYWQVNILTYEWHHQGQLHRVGKPAVIDKYKNKIKWCRHGDVHRGDGEPAIVDIAGDYFGNTVCKWVDSGNYHISTEQNRLIESCKFCRICHRANTEYRNRYITEAQWWLDSVV